MGMYERRERWVSFVRDMRIDIGSAHIQEQPRYPLEGRRSPRIDTCVHSRDPRQQHQVAVVRVVIRMMVCDENVPQGGDGHTSGGHLPSDSITAIHYIRDAVSDDYL
jgi:hypothetical protein